MRKFLTSRGFSLLQALMMTGLISAAALVGTKMIAGQKTAQKAAEIRGDIEILNSLVQTILQDKKHCTANFVVGQPVKVGTILTQIVPAKSDIATAPSTPVIKINEHSGQAPSAGTTDQNGVYIANKISIKEIKVASSVPGGTIPEALEITYLQHRDKLKAKEIRKSIPIRFRMDSSGNLRDCYMDEMAYNTLLYKEFCQLPGLSNFFTWVSVNGAWDSLGECNIDKRDCSAQPGTVFQGFDMAGAPICKKLTDIIPPEDIFDTSKNDCTPSLSSAVKLEVINNKIKVTCQACSPTCAELVPTVCTGVDAGSACGIACGMGTKDCTTCTDTCAAKVATVCQGTDAGTVCEVACGMGTKVCDKSCVRINSFTTPAECVGNQFATDEYKIVDSTGTTVGHCYDEHGHPECIMPGSYTNTCPSYPGCPSGCTPDPATSCGVKVQNTCSGQNAGSDSCGTGCGVGIKDCSATPPSTCPATKPACPAGSYEVEGKTCVVTDPCTADCKQWGSSCENILHCRRLNAYDGTACSIM